MISRTDKEVLRSRPSCAYEPRPGAAVVEPSGAVTYGAEFQRALGWSPAALARLERIPSFVRGVVMQRVEEYARRRGGREVTVELLSAVRCALPTGSSKRRRSFTEPSS